MVEWPRSTPWRQGSILNRGLLSSSEQRFAGPSQGIDIAVVVSHDCDIAANPIAEPRIEVIPVAFLPNENGSLTHAKDPRRLHLKVIHRVTGEPYFIEFKATDKTQIPKEQLAGLFPSDEYALAPKQLEILRRWLAARYRRHAFSDEFEQRFQKVEQKFKEILKQSSSHIRAILFDVDEDSGRDATGNPTVYVLDIYLIYTGEDASEESLKVAQSTKARIEKAFQNKYRRAGEWRMSRL